MALSFFIPDSLHINKRNFASFFKFIEENKIKTHFESSHNDWIALYGNYESKQAELNDKIDVLSELKEQELFQFKIYDINLFHIARAELLSLLASQPEWYNEKYPETQELLFKKIYQQNRITLLQNMAAAWYWLLFWKQKLNDLPQFSHACIFSGSLIYQKSLVSLLQYTPTKVMLMESLFTGNEYYCEENYGTIANGSSIKQLAIYKKYKRDYLNHTDYSKEKIKATNKIIQMNNKNVQQPEQSEKLKFNQKAPTVAIIGQVVNDFSVLEYNQIGLNTVDFYKNLILSLAKNEFNIVIKTHPWEEKKNNIKTPLTKEILTQFVETLSEEEQSRIKIVDHYNIQTLFKQADYVVGLNSQGLLEAAFEGFKPIQFGKAFYGKKGFTSDYTCEQLGQFITDLKQGKINSTMTLSEFDQFELFITILLQKHTISIHNSGLINLRQLFQEYQAIKLVSRKK